MVKYEQELIKNHNEKMVSCYDFRIKKMVKYYNTIFSFDIETTSTYTDNEKFAFMYEWTFGKLDDVSSETICYGRTWNDFLTLYDEIVANYNTSENKRCIIWVHNLGYEFQFMRKYFNFLSVFSVDERKPIKALTEEGIEFRDTYILSAMSLAKVADNLSEHIIEKMVGDLDYKLIRTEKTNLTEKELKYCENDVKIILYYIDEQKKQFCNNVAKIPLTNTGRVRDYVRNNCLYTNKSHKKSSAGKFNRYRALMQELTITSHEYSLLKQCFAGGYTHANSYYVNKKLENVSSIDFTSSYPFVMLSEKFPMSKPRKLENLTQEQFENLVTNENHGLMMKITFYDIESKVICDDYISEHKCLNIQNQMINNGRVHSADFLTLVVTDLDYKIIEKCYKYSSFEIHEIYDFYMTYLPKAIINSILDLYNKKTTLKGVEGYETEYMVSKQMLNSIYGMCVTDIVRDEILYNEEVWETEKADIEKNVEKYNTSKRRFLYYPWGVWVTAYARFNLWTGILNIYDDYVYSDTDSIKFLNLKKHEKFINTYNKNVKKKLKKMCEFMNIEFKLCEPKTKKGEKKLIGVWDFEGTYNSFKTLGAKRYLVKKDDKYYLTLAGLSKKAGMNYIIEKCKNNEKNIFDFFNNNMYIPANKTGKNTHTYIDDVMEKSITDCEGNRVFVKSLSSIHLEECEFSLSMSDKYLTFLDEIQQGILSKEV